MLIVSLLGCYCRKGKISLHMWLWNRLEFRERSADTCIVGSVIKWWGWKGTWEIISSDLLLQGTAPQRYWLIWPRSHKLRKSSRGVWPAALVMRAGNPCLCFISPFLYSIGVSEAVDKMESTPFNRRQWTSMSLRVTAKELSLVNKNKSSAIVEIFSK